jgi:hypothetical protein
VIDDFVQEKRFQKNDVVMFRADSVSPDYVDRSIPHQIHIGVIGERDNIKDRRPFPMREWQVEVSTRKVKSDILPNLWFTQCARLRAMSMTKIGRL